MFFFDEEKLKRSDNRPPIGTTFYVVREHLYYVLNRAGPMLEYIVCAGKVRRFIIGNRAEMELILENAGANNLAYPEIKEIGKTVFHTAREAALLAKAMTEDYERRWAWTERWGDVPLRRPWEHLLTEEKGNAV